MPVPGAPRPARVATAAFLAALTIAVSAAAAKDPEPIDLPGLLARIGERVEAYYARAQSILCIETVRLQPMDYNFTSADHVRRLVYELRVSWDPSTDGSVPEANVTRQLISVDGRPPKPKDEPGCLDPEARRARSAVVPAAAPPARIQVHLQGHRPHRRPRRRADRLRAGRLAAARDQVERPCVSINLPTRTTGRLWIDVASGNVLRIDEKVTGPLRHRGAEVATAEGRERLAHARSRRLDHPLQDGGCSPIPRRW